MAIDATFMAALMKIPYFAELSEQNGDEWLGNLFQSLEVESFDFSQFQTLLGDSSIVDLSAADLIVDIADATKEDGDAKSAKRSGDEIEQAQAAMFANEVAKESAAGSSSDESGGTRQPNFANQKLMPIEPGPTDWDRRLKWEALQQEPDYSIFKLGEDSGSVALNGVYGELKLSAFDDKIYTTDGYSGSGTTTVNGGDGIDTLHLTAGGLKTDLGGESDFGRFGGRVEFRGVENVIGSDGNDNITGNAGDNKLLGRAGNDKIDGGAGNDTIDGGSGNNHLDGGAGNDIITGGSGVDDISGGSGNDVINAGGGADQIFGGDGDDRIDAGAGADQIDGGKGDDEIDGGSGNDEIDGGAGDDEIEGGDGDDTIDGGDGKDVLNGGLGNDTITGGLGDDKIDGGDGNDKLDGDAGKDTINGGIGDDTISGGADDDNINGGDGKDVLSGDAGKDTIVGAAGDDTINGGADDDNIDGGADNDVILGGDGNDVLKGGVGDDTITGGVGADTITGGDGHDVYVYTNITDSGLVADTFDIITDFDVANDKFDLTALLANDEFDFITAEGGAFTGGSNNSEVRWDKTGGATIIEIDIDGNGVADMQIKLDDQVDLTAANFNL